MLCLASRTVNDLSYLLSRKIFARERRGACRIHPTNLTIMSTKFYLSISLRSGEDRTNVKATYVVDGTSYNLSGGLREHLIHCCQIKGLPKPVFTDYRSIIYLKDAGYLDITGLVLAFDEGQSIDIASGLKSTLSKIENLVTQLAPKIDIATLMI